MAHRQGYRDLKVWQQAIDLVPQIYALVKTFPREEIYALSDQIRRAAVSVPANIAEGPARLHSKEFLHHLAIARGSFAELDTLLIVAHRLGYLTTVDLDAISTSLLDVRMPLQGLINTPQRNGQRTTENGEPGLRA